MRNRRETPEINAGSMADIAFLLLIFWLVATSIKPERGIPETIEDADKETKIAVPVKVSDMIRLKVSEDGTYLVNGVEITIEQLEKLAVRLIRRSGPKAKLVLTADYEAPYEEYVLVLRLAENLNLHVIENEIKDEMDKETE